MSGKDAGGFDSEAPRGAWDAAVHELEVALDVDDRLAGVREQFAEVAA